MTSAKRHLKFGELRPVIIGEPREKRRERAIYEVHDPGIACAGRVVRGNDLRGNSFDVCRFDRAEKRQPGLARQLGRGVRFLGGLRDLRPSDGQGRCAKGGDDELEDRSSGDRQRPWVSPCRPVLQTGSKALLWMGHRLHPEHCEFEEVSGLVRDAAGNPCQHAREPIRGYLEV
jgi:hypothetical protein